MRTIRRLAALIAAGLLGACVSIEEAPMTTGAIQKDQRLLLLVFPAPGPIVSEDDSKGETAAKIMPGLALLVTEAQDQRDLKTAQDLQQYLPAWDPAAAFLPAFKSQVSALGQPGKLIAAEETELPADTWVRLNQSSDSLDWQHRYFSLPLGHAVARNYSSFLALDDALVLEVNLAYGLNSDGEGLYTPTAKAVTKLLRASTMRQFWRHEDSVSDKAAARALYDFKVKPEDLIFAWKRLLPLLGAQVAENLGKNLVLAKVPVANAPASGVSLSTSVPSGLPSGPGWGPAPTVPTAPLPPAGLTR